MQGYTVTSINMGMVYMSKKDGHGGESKTNCSVKDFKKSFGKNAKVGVVA